jgi:hypothetical protein
MVDTMREQGYNTMQGTDNEFAVTQFGCQGFYLASSEQAELLLPFSRPPLC